MVVAVQFHCKGRQYDNVSDGSCDGVGREPAAVPLLIPNRCPLGERSELGGGLGSARLGSAPGVVTSPRGGAGSPLTHSLLLLLSEQTPLDAAQLGSARLAVSPPHPPAAADRSWSGSRLD